MTGNAPTHTCSYFCDKPECIKAQRDELRDKLAALESQPVPVEPECITKMRRLPKGAAYEVEHKTLDYIDTLQSALHRAQEKYEQAVSNKQIAEAQCAELLQRAEKAEADLKLAQEERDAKFEQLQISEAHLKLAESINRRMVELMKEATDELREYLDGPCALTKSRTDTDCGCVSCTVRKAMRPLINEATK